MSKRVLGRGLDALIPKGSASTPVDTGVKHIPVDQIMANPFQPRKSFDQEKLRGLSESIETDGVLQPVVVRQTENGYELIMGERRLQAARLAGRQTVPAVVKRVEDIDALRLALVENLQRENLNPIEVAEAYRSLVDQFGLSQNELAKLVGKDRSSVANTMRLLGLPEEIRAMLQSGAIREGHARALLGLPTRAEQLAMARRIERNNLNVRDVETATTERRTNGSAKVAREKAPHIKELENAFSNRLGTRVVIDEKKSGKGKITIEFYSHEEFERLAESMSVSLPR